MKLIVNGQPREFPPETTLRQLLTVLALQSGQVAIEVNERVVRRALHDSHSLAEGDRVEIVTFVGGG